MNTETRGTFRVLAYLSFALIVLRVFEIGTLIRVFFIAADAVYGAPVPQDEVAAMIQREERLIIVWWIVIVVYAASLLLFNYLAYRRLHDAGVPNLRFTPGQAAALYLVPIWGFIHSLLTLQELHRAVQHDPQKDYLFDWRDELRSDQISVAWGLSVASFVLDVLTHVYVGDAPEAHVLRNATVTWMVAGIMAIVATLLFLAVMNRLAREIDAYKPKTGIPMSHLQFEFKPRWKEELVCSSVLGNLVLDMPTGVTSVYLPAAESWSRQAPQWAQPFWSDLHSQLAQWCANERVPFHVEESAKVYEEARR